MLLNDSLITHAIGRKHIGNGLYGPGVIEESINETLFMYSHVCLGTSWMEK